jgi:hypothetical protein
VVTICVLGVALFSHTVSQIGVPSCSSGGVPSQCP